MVDSIEQSPRNNLEKIIEKTRGHYRDAFFELVMPNIQNANNIENTKKLVQAFKESLPADESEKQQFLDACQQHSSLLPEVLLSAYDVWSVNKQQ